jgi:hypothetical protein
MSGSWHPRGHWHYSANGKTDRIGLVEQHKLSKEETLEKATISEYNKGRYLIFCFKVKCGVLICQAA